MAETRWQRVERQQSEQRQRERQKADLDLSRWTGRWPLTFLVGCLCIGLLFLLVGLGYYRHDAPLRRTDLPVIDAQVMDRHQGKNDWALLRYAAEGRHFEQKVRWYDRPPPIGATTPLRFVPGDPERVRPAGAGWNPGYARLFALAVAFSGAGPLGYTLSVVSARRARKRDAARTGQAAPGAP